MSKCCLAACLAVLSPLQTAADLGAALRRSGSSSSHSPAVLPADAALSGALVVPLERVRARSETAKGASFYLGKVSVGHPAQSLQVLFDTSSGQVILPHRACKSEACLAHRSFSPWASSTAMDVNVNGTEVQAGVRLARGKVMRDGVTVSYTQSDLGEGDAEAVLVRDTLCMEGQPGRRACVDLAVLAAVKEDDVPFQAMPNDGIVGLGLSSLAVSPLASFVGRLLEGSRNVLPQFGILLGANGGELYFGGHPESRIASPIQWFPVDHSGDGYWQVAIQAVYVGEHLVDDCQRGCHGIVDTGVSRLGVQASSLPKLRAALRAGLSQRRPCLGAPLKFDLGEMVLSLGSQDYMGEDCEPELGALNLEEPTFKGVYAFGETVLRQYYAAMDWEQQRLGFAPIAQEPSSVKREVVVF